MFFMILGFGFVVNTSPESGKLQRGGASDGVSKNGSNKLNLVWRTTSRSLFLISYPNQKLQMTMNSCMILKFIYL